MTQLGVFRQLRKVSKCFTPTEIRWVSCHYHPLKVSLLVCIKCHNFLSIKTALLKNWAKEEQCNFKIFSVVYSCYMHFVMHMFVFVHITKEFISNCEYSGSFCSSGHPSTSRWPSAANSALEILLEIPISTSWILQRPSKANQRHQPPRRSSQHSVAQGVPPRAKATQEDTAERSGEKVHVQERHFSQPRCCLYD